MPQRRLISVLLSLACVTGLGLFFFGGGARSRVALPSSHDAAVFEAVGEVVPSSRIDDAVSVESEELRRALITSTADDALAATAKAVRLATQARNSASSVIAVNGVSGSMPRGDAGRAITDATGAYEFRADFDLELQRAGSLEFSVTKPDGSLPSVRLELRHARDSDSTAPTLRSLQSGHGTVHGLVPGTWTVRARELYAPIDSFVERDAEVVADQTRHVEVDLPL